MTFILLFLVIPILIGGALALIWRKNVKKKLAQIFGIAVATPFTLVAGSLFLSFIAAVIAVILIPISIIGLIFLGLSEKSYIIDNEKTLVSCSFNEDIKQANYTHITYDNSDNKEEVKNSFIYYRKGNKKIIIDPKINKFEIENIQEDNPDFLKNVDLETGSTISFPVLSYLQENKFEIIDQGFYDNIVKQYTKKN